MIEIKHLEKKYNDLTILKDINVHIQKGEIISIIGPSGTGKSTFLRCLNLLEIPTKGEIIIEGQNILQKDLDISKVRQKMGMVFQSFNLFSHLMIIENIILGPVEILKMDKQTAYNEAMKLLEMVGLKDKAYSYPDELSGGQKQRIAIARALAMKPEIILFDEPTSALDPTMVGEVLGVIKRLAKEGLTMLIVTHEMNFARDVSTKVFYMDEGIIYEQGTPQEIFENPKRPKTKAFINKIKSYNFEITNISFDYYKINSDIVNFGNTQGISKKNVNNMQLIFEETIVNTLIPYLKSNVSYYIQGSIRYYENSNEIEFEFRYAGDKFNPFEQKADELSMIIIKKISKNVEYVFDKENIMKIVI